MKIDLQATFYLAMNKDGRVVECDTGDPILFCDKNGINAYDEFDAFPVKLLQVEEQQEQL